MLEFVGNNLHFNNFAVPQQVAVEPVFLVLPVVVGPFVVIRVERGDTLAHEPGPSVGRGHLLDQLHEYVGQSYNIFTHC